MVLLQDNNRPSGKSVITGEAALCPLRFSRQHVVAVTGRTADQQRERAKEWGVWAPAEQVGHEHEGLG